jgi:flagellar FliL protein
MANTDVAAGAGDRKQSRKPLVIGLLLALAGAGSGFYAVFSGLISNGESRPAMEAAPDFALPDVGFVALEPMVISLGPRSNNRHLRFAAQLEVPTASLADVQRVLPRVVDVLNSYLRVISVSELSDPASLARLRAQMLRRIQVVTGAGRVRDLLVTQFVVN